MLMEQPLTLSRVVGGLRRRLRRLAPGGAGSELGETRLSAGIIDRLEGTLREEGRDAFLAQLSDLEGHPIDETVIRHVDGHIELIQEGRRRIATTDPSRRARKGEFVILFGHFPPGHHGLIVNNPAQRNVLDFWTCGLGFDAVESQSCFAPVGRIFIINLDDRPDRYYATVRELARAGAPLDAVTRFSACVPAMRGDRRIAGTVGCLQSHLEVMRQARAGGHEHVLVLEDDFSFIDDLPRVHRDLAAFFSRKYDYDVCLLATSKHGRIDMRDDLVGVTRQRATNTAGYLVSRPGMERLEACFAKALDSLLATGRIDRFAADRCWAEQQGERFLVFKRRLGFQLPSRSDIEGKILLNFD